MSQTDNGGGFLTGLVLGALVGAGLGLLWSPRSGMENRERLLEKFPELRTRAPDALSHALARAKSRLEEGTEAFRDAASETRERMRQQLVRAQQGQVGSAGPSSGNGSGQGEGDPRQ